VTASERDKEYWRKVARDAKLLEEEPGSGSPETRRMMLALINTLRRQIGMPPAIDEDEHPPELGFYERAKARGLLRSPGRAD
jgi:hypothetical protein